MRCRIRQVENVAMANRYIVDVPDKFEVETLPAGDYLDPNL